MKPRHKLLTKLLFPTALIILLLYEAIAFLGHWRQTRVIGYAKSESGVQLCVVQRPGDILSTSVYYRKPGAPWGWFYYDHESFYWRKVDIIADETNKTMTIMRGSDVIASFQWESEVYWSARTQERHKGAQKWMPTNFSPWVAVR